MLKFLSVNLILVLFVVNTSGQINTRDIKNDNTIPSPYSHIGLGDIELVGSTRHMGLAQTGIALPNSNYVNMFNPALTAYNYQNVIFDAAVTLQNVGIKNSNQSQYNTGANFHYFNVLFPIKAKLWSSFIGIRPHSNVNTSFDEKLNITGSENSTSALKEINVKSEFSGGLTKFYMTHGIKLPKNFAVGLNISYIFGNISRTSISNIGSDNNYSIYKSREIYKNFEFTFGASYYKKLNSGKNLFFGATYGFNLDAGSTDSITISQNSYINSVQSFRPYYIFRDQINDNLKVVFPPKIGLGIAIDKINKYNIAIDYTLTAWSNYVGYSNDDILLSDAHRLSIGAEYLPKFDAIRGYYNRITFRSGFYYHLTPYEINGKKITELGASIGAGFPIGKGTLSTLNFALQIGQRGTTSNGLVKENYIKLFLGINVNDRWFTRYKLD